MKNQYINGCFYTNLSLSNKSVNLNKSTDLLNQWNTVSKTKQKLYYKLYYNLLKSQIIKNHKNKETKRKWVCNNFRNYKCLDLLNYPLHSISRYNKFSGKHLKGYTRYGEKIYVLQSMPSNNFYTSYNKLKKYIIN